MKTIVNPNAKMNVLAVRVRENVYTRHNDDADIAGMLVAMISNLVKLRYSEECDGLINHYNFVEIPSVDFFMNKIVPGFCEFLEISEERLMNLVEIVFLPTAE